jgi:uncharacterized protein
MGERMSDDNNALNWFEISVSDISRAKKFYEQIFDIQLSEMEMEGMKYAMFPFKPGSGKAGGGLAQSQMHKPASTGVLIYLNANPDLQNVLNRIEKAGGKITMPKTAIGENGFMAFFNDTEGNVIGLHSNG